MSEQSRGSLQPAFVLHRSPYRETSLLVEMFTADHGRIGMVARGVRRGKSAQQALLQPFTALLVSWTARGELATLTGVEARPGPPPVHGLGLMSAFYVNELLLRLLHRHEPHEELFQAYEQVLHHLTGQPAQMEWPLRLFETTLLQELGYGLILDHEADSGIPLQAQIRYNYVPQYGPVRFSAERAGPAVHGATLLALQQETAVDEQVLAEAKQLLRHELHSHLGGKPLRSREMFRAAMTHLAPGQAETNKEQNSDQRE